VEWLKEGENNTKFFHHSMIHKSYINCITKLENDQGQQILDHEGMENELINYYINILSKSIPDRSQAINKITQHIPALISREKMKHS
jgi:hypothetical protein